LACSDLGEVRRMLGLWVRGESGWRFIRIISGL